MRSTKSCRTWREHVFIGSATLRRAGCTASGLKPASSSGSQADCACSRRRIGPGCGAYIVGVCVLGQNLARPEFAPEFGADTLYCFPAPQASCIPAPSASDCRAALALARARIPWPSRAKSPRRAGARAALPRPRKASRRVRSASRPDAVASVCLGAWWMNGAPATAADSMGISQRIASSAHRCFLPAMTPSARFAMAGSKTWTAAT